MLRKYRIFDSKYDLTTPIRDSENICREQEREYIELYR